jgi:hypothetical protein
MKNIFIAMILSFTSVSVFGQDIDFKKGVVYIDGKETFKYEGSDLKGTFSFSNLQGEEIIFMKLEQNIRNSKDVHWKIVFLKEKRTLTTKYNIPTKKSLFQKLVKDGVLANGAIVADKLDTFFAKYEEHVE